jgi:hypothetical protein
LHLVYAVLVVNSLSWDGEIERDDFSFSSVMMVVLWARKSQTGDKD